ncbi:hypothetical protein FI667_g11515, partial [Globisporangium splendens]
MDASAQNNATVTLVRAPSNPDAAALVSVQVVTNPTSASKNSSDQGTTSDGAVTKKKEKWYKRIKLQPVIYRYKCSM